MIAEIPGEGVFELQIHFPTYFNPKTPLKHHKNLFKPPNNPKSKITQKTKNQPNKNI